MDRHSLVGDFEGKAPADRLFEEGHGANLEQILNVQKEPAQNQGANNGRRQ
jgi:hypothetical protein